MDERYRVLERVGQGGMGVVYKVEHVRIGKVAAMKLLHRRLCGEPALLKRFRIEAEAISKLNHPNIVQVFDYGQVLEQPYLVMEYLHGEDLGTIVKRDGPLPLRRLVPLLIQVCDALTEAHELGIVHRDLKPENIQVSRTRAGLDHAKVLDFGLAKVLGEGVSTNDSTAGNLVGTPYYMAPEQIRGHPIDHRCDIYALGALTYRVLTGNHAFTARTPVGVLTKHITEVLVLPSRSAPNLGISSSIDQVVVRAMAKAPEQRYETIAQLKIALVEAANRSLSGEVDIAPEVFSSELSGQMLKLQRRASDASLRDSSPDLDPGAPLPPPPDGSALATPGSALEITPPRLTRADLHFDRKVYRGRRVGIALLVLVLLSAASAAGWWFYLRERPVEPPTIEIEPNNTTAQATQLVANKRVTGMLGKRLSKTASDMDWYTFRVEGETPRALTVTVSPIPNIDLVVELYDRLGGRLALADGTEKGGHERVFGWPVQPGTYYVLVREVVDQGSVPTENITDSYSITVSWAPLAANWEREPNDTDRQSNTLTLGSELRGTLGAPNDVDSYRLDVPTGKLEGLVSAIPKVDIVVEVLVDGADKPRRFDSGKVGGGERIFDIATNGKKPVIVRVRRKHTDKLKAIHVPGQKSPYTLRIWTPS
ncbi:MAG: hypothetical protein CSB49_05910 [Proteobacteria bacterium]|nr:MAG: hypothetical protein CSB49_05910 [Pseudomonadota bacterium]